MEPLWKTKKKVNDSMDSEDLYKKLECVGVELLRLEKMETAEKINFLQAKLRDLMDIEFLIEDHIMFLKREFRK